MAEKKAEAAPPAADAAGAQAAPKKGSKKKLIIIGAVAGVLLLGGGVLVWLNGEPSSRLSRVGGSIGLGLWLLLQVIPGLNAFLQLGPLPGLLPVVLPLALLLLLVSGRVQADAESGPIQHPNR